MILSFADPNYIEILGAAETTIQWFKGSVGGKGRALKACSTSNFDEYLESIDLTFELLKWFHRRHLASVGEAQRKCIGACLLINNLAKGATL